MDRKEKESLRRKEQWYTRAEESCSLSEQWGCLELSRAPGIRLRQQGRVWEAGGGGNDVEIPLGLGGRIPGS